MFDILVKHFLHFGTFFFWKKMWAMFDIQSLSPSGTLSCRTRRDYMELISYCDMGFGALSIFFSTLLFIHSLPLSREGHEFVIGKDMALTCIRGVVWKVISLLALFFLYLSTAHDVTTVSFMASVVLHFLQLLEAVRLLNSTEHQNYQDDPEESIRLAKSWQGWSIFFLVLLLVKFFIIHSVHGTSFLFILYSVFLGLEFCFRVHSRYSVEEFILEMEAGIPYHPRYTSRYQWNN